MKNWILLFFTFIAQFSLAESLDLRNLQIRVIDQHGSPIENLRVSFEVQYSVIRYHIACLYPSPIYIRTTASCPFPEIGETFYKTTSKDGIIKFENTLSHLINRLRAINPSVEVTFESRIVPKCLGLNYFKRSPDAPGAENLPPFVFDRTIRISNHTLALLKNQNTNQIVCQF